MDEVTQQNSALVEENAATAKTLEHQAKAMDERVSFFKLAVGSDVATADRSMAAEPPPPTRGPASVQRHSAPKARGGDINLDAAIAKHTEWKAKLRRAIASWQQLDAATISKDNCCDLGKWLHGGGKAKLGHKPEFQAVVGLHRTFHAEAGKVAEFINAKKYSEAEQALDNGTSYSEASDSVRSAIHALKKDIAAESDGTTVAASHRGPVGRIQSALIY